MTKLTLQRLLVGIAESAIVEDGTWEIGVGADFRGACEILRPGRYPDLQAYGNRVSSGRPVDNRR